MAILLIANTLFYAILNGVCFAQLIRGMGWNQWLMALYCMYVLFSAFLLLLTINSLHPDLFSFKLRRNIRAHENHEQLSLQFL